MGENFPHFKKDKCEIAHILHSNQIRRRAYRQAEHNLALAVKNLISYSCRNPISTGFIVIHALGSSARCFIN